MKVILDAADEEIRYDEESGSELVQGRLSGSIAGRHPEKKFRTLLKTVATHAEKQWIEENGLLVVMERTRTNSKCSNDSMTSKYVVRFYPLLPRETSTDSSAMKRKIECVHQVGNN